MEKGSNCVCDSRLTVPRIHFAIVFTLYCFISQFLSNFGLVLYVCVWVCLEAHVCLLACTMYIGVYLFRECFHESVCVRARERGLQCDSLFPGVLSFQFHSHKTSCWRRRELPLHKSRRSGKRESKELWSCKKINKE